MCNFCKQYTYITILSAFANDSMATASLPGVLAASLETASAINISALPGNRHTNPSYNLLSEIKICFRKLVKLSNWNIQTSKFF